MRNSDSGSINDYRFARRARDTVIISIVTHTLATITLNSLAAAAVT